MSSMRPRHLLSSVSRCTQCPSHACVWSAHVPSCHRCQRRRRACTRTARQPCLPDHLLALLRSLPRRSRVDGPLPRVSLLTLCPARHCRWLAGLRMHGASDSVRLRALLGGKGHRAPQPRRPGCFPCMHGGLSNYLVSLTRARPPCGAQPLTTCMGVQLATSESRLSTAATPVLLGPRTFVLPLSPPCLWPAHPLRRRTRLPCVGGCVQQRLRAWQVGRRA